MDYLFEKEIYIFGIKRAGMHAIRIWLSEQREPKNSDLYFQNNTHFTLTYRRYAHRNRTLKSKLDSLSERRWQKPKFYINIIESADLLDIKRKLEDREYDLNVHKKEILLTYNIKKFSKEIYNIIVIRNPFHHLASNIAQHRLQLEESGISAWSDRHIAFFRERWIQYAKEFLGITNYLPAKCCILYDKWFSSIKYRQKISQQLNLTFNDAGLNLVTSMGSSFDQKNFHKHAQEMNVLGRWKQLQSKDRILYSQIINNEMIGLWELIQGLNGNK